MAIKIVNFVQDLIAASAMEL